MKQVEIITQRKMGYGALAGIPIVTRTPVKNIATVAPTARVIIIPTSSRHATENTPLIRRRRLRRRSEAEMFLNWRILALLLILVVGTFIGIHLMVIDYNGLPLNYPFHLIDRNFWYRGVPIEHLNLPLLDSSQVSKVIIFHTRSAFCFNFSTCLYVISEMHQRNFSDIPFNFLIGGDGKTYELRGWKYRSGFEIPFNNQSITVGLIGDFTVKEPAENQVHEVKALISESVRRQKLSSNYQIHGARLHLKDGNKMFKFFKTLSEWAGWI